MPETMAHEERCDDCELDGNRRRRGLFGRWWGSEEPVTSVPAAAPAEEARTLPLVMVSTGETVRLSAIEDCTKLRKRLADLGLNIGLTVRVVKNDFLSPMILAVKQDSRLALDRSLARCIRVQVE
jgi:Fe2+ transport system protein FeoA